MAKPPSHSGKFVLRIPPPLHRRLANDARHAGVSLNEYCTDRLASEHTGSSGPLDDIVSTAMRHLGADLVAVAVFGSYARGQAAADSDIDILIVTTSSTVITRSLYVPWDAGKQFLDRHIIEPHIVSMPETGDRITGLWAEVSIDGAVIFDPSLTLSRHLARVRRAIIEGTLVRRTANGQTYWAAA